MVKLIALGLALACLICSTTADPIFLSSSKRINDISKTLFFNADSFNSLLNDKILLRESLPSNIYVFDVKLNDKKYVENQSLLMKELASSPAIKKHFSASPNTFSSAYVEGALTPEFSEQLLKNIENAGNYKLVKSSLKKFNAVKDNNNQLLSVITLPVSELNSLKTALNQITLSQTNDLVILKFTDDSDSIAPQILAKLEANERLLQDEDVGDVGDVAPNAPVEQDPTDTTASQPTTTKLTDDPSYPAPTISPAGLAGIVISAVLLIGVYIGFQVLSGIKPPSRFEKGALQIGKEQ